MQTRIQTFARSVYNTSNYSLNYSNCLTTCCLNLFYFKSYCYLFARGLVWKKTQKKKLSDLTGKYKFSIQINIKIPLYHKSCWLSSLKNSFHKVNFQVRIACSLKTGNFLWMWILNVHAYSCVHVFYRCEHSFVSQLTTIMFYISYSNICYPVMLRF